jgi:hypothetical protein
MKIQLGKYKDVSIEIDLQDDDDIHLMPLSNRGTYKLTDSLSRKHLTILYYIGIKSFYKSFEYNETNRAEMVKQRQEFIDSTPEINKVDQVICVKAKELTEKIARNFRYVQPVIEYPKKKVKIPPYYLGLWLGDGTSSSVSITTIDPEVEVYLQEMCNATDLHLNFGSKQGTDAHTCNISGNKGVNWLRQELVRYDLKNNKHIPDDYKYNSVEVRLQVIAGLIDTDGYLSGSTFEIVQKNETLAKDIIEIARSVGIFAVETDSKKICTNAKDGPKACMYKRMYLSPGPLCPVIPTHLQRKRLESCGQGKKIHIGENAIPAAINKWDDSLKQLLCSVVKKYKEEVKEIVDWNVIRKYDEKFKLFSNDALRTCYKDFNKQFTELIKCDKPFNLVPDDWRERYETIKLLHDGNQKLEKTHKTWLHNQKSRYNKLNKYAPLCEEQEKMLAYFFEK